MEIRLFLSDGESGYAARLKGVWWIFYTLNRIFGSRACAGMQPAVVQVLTFRLSEPPRDATTGPFSLRAGRAIIRAGKGRREWI